MAKLLRRLTVFDSILPFEPVEWSPPTAVYCGWSKLFYCSRCGETYAKIRSYIDDRLVPFKALSGCCSLCPGDSYTVPGSLHDPIGFVYDYPLEVWKYQLDCELSFYDSAQHPRYKEENQCILPL